MNLKTEIVEWPKQYKKIPKPFYVVRCGDHFIVVTLTDNYELIGEHSGIHWNKYVVRDWAFELAKKNGCE